MIRQTPYLTECSFVPPGAAEPCGAPMAAIRGPYNSSIGRPKPPMGYRLGYVKETADGPEPICAECVAYSLPSNIQKANGG